MSSLWISSSAAEEVESAQFIIVLPSRYGFETVDSAMRPSLSLMPYCVTILRASSRRTLNVVRRAGRGDAEDDLLGSAAAQHGLEFDDEFFFAGQELFLLRHLHGVAQSSRRYGVRW